MYTDKFNFSYLRAKIKTRRATMLQSRANYIACIVCSGQIKLRKCTLYSEQGVVENPFLATSSC